MGTASYTFETLPPVSKEEWERIDAIKDEDIDYSEIPEIKDLSGLRLRQVRELNTKKEKVPFSCNLDADIVERLKAYPVPWKRTLLRSMETVKPPRLPYLRTLKS